MWCRRSRRPKRYVCFANVPSQINRTSRRARFAGVWTVSRSRSSWLRRAQRHFPRTRSWNAWTNGCPSSPAARATPRTARRTLRATIEWSFNLLHEDEQRLFARLAVFSGGCTLDAAEQVVEAELDTLQSLVEKSLLRHSEERFWMLETIREYAAERLDRAEEEELLTRRHAAYFADIVEEAGRALNGPLEKTAREHVAPDTANVVAATEWARTQPDGDFLLRLAVGGEVLRLPPRQQILWLDEALSRASARPTALLAHGYRNAGGLYFSAIRDLETAQARLEKSASLYRQLNDPAQESDVLRMLGSVLGDAGDQPAARATLERALALARESGGRPHAILHHLGELERGLGGHGARSRAPGRGYRGRTARR